MMSASATYTQRTSRSVVLTILAVALLLVVALSLSIGQLFIAPAELGALLAKKAGWTSIETSAVHEAVLWSIRLPRILMTLLIGAALAVSGAALQGLFRNPLVEPGLIGVSSGAALAVVLLIVFGGLFSITRETGGMQVWMPAAAFAGGLLTTVVVMRLAGQLGKTNMAVLILGGVAVNALAGALMGLAIFYADENQLRTFTFWTLGDLGGATWRNLAVAGPVLLVATVGLLFFQQPLNAIAVGEAEAFHMGVDVEQVKRNIVLLSALAVGVSVSLAGTIGFVGLVVPHLVRVLFHSDHQMVLPASLLGGPLLLLLADLVARTVVAPSELPIGVVTALVGAPFFIFLLLRSKKSNELFVS
jgi:iron complex transport system permease protein